MIEPTDADIGRTVLYRAHPGAMIERGVIESFNGSLVFVRYEFGVAGTYHESLEWEHEEPRSISGQDGA
jgi:hypothetical protein